MYNSVCIACLSSYYMIVAQGRASVYRFMCASVVLAKVYKSVDVSTRLSAVAARALADIVTLVCIFFSQALLPFQ